jgi:exosortase/archaeosortase family protein
MFGATTTKNLSLYVRQSLASKHGRLTLLALMAGAVYFPTWLAEQWKSVLTGGSSLLINAALLWLGFRLLWRDRQALQQLTPSKDDRLAGHLLIVGGAFWLPFILHSASMQALVWLLVLIGVAWSSFGLNFFWRYIGACLMIAVGMYPSAVFLANRAVNALIEPEVVERQVAWLGSQALQLIGYGAEAESRYILLNDQTILVEYPCTGVDMAISIAGLSFIVGLLFHQSILRIALAMATSVIVAMTSNIPRVMLMVIAWVYWGQESFDFWHGTWGGQIFATIMFTVAYYAIAPIYDIKKQSRGP